MQLMTSQLFCYHTYQAWNMEYVIDGLKQILTLNGMGPEELIAQKMEAARRGPNTPQVDEYVMCLVILFYFIFICHFICHTEQIIHRMPDIKSTTVVFG